jgi:phage repressor protein C with HTH and peptisase S24 domain
MIDTSKKTLEDGKVFLVRRPDGKTSIRRAFQMISGGWALRSDNLDKQRYPDETLSSEAADGLPIVGQIAWRGGSAR